MNDPFVADRCVSRDGDEFAAVPGLDREFFDALAEGDVFLEHYGVDFYFISKVDG